MTRNDVILEFLHEHSGGNTIRSDLMADEIVNLRAERDRYREALGNVMPYAEMMQQRLKAEEDRIECAKAVHAAQDLFSRQVRSFDCSQCRDTGWVDVDGGPKRPCGCTGEEAAK
jgi:hypothetical protein